MSDSAKIRIIGCVSRAFLDHGYAALSMSALADCCGLTRRALYHHFSNKEELFRAVIRYNNDVAMLNGDAAGTAALARGTPPVDTIALWLDERFGATRREMGRSAHGQELNDIAFRLATDIMIEVSSESNDRLAGLVEECCRRHQLQLRNGCSHQRVGRLIGDGARGINQARPPIPNHELSSRYRDMVEALLFGCAAPAADGGVHIARSSRRKA